VRSKLRQPLFFRIADTEVDLIDLSLDRPLDPKGDCRQGTERALFFLSSDEFPGSAVPFRASPEVTSM